MLTHMPRSIFALIVDGRQHHPKISDATLVHMVLTMKLSYIAVHTRHVHMEQEAISRLSVDTTTQRDISDERTPIHQWNPPKLQTTNNCTRRETITQFHTISKESQARLLIISMRWLANEVLRATQKKWLKCKLISVRAGVRIGVYTTGGSRRRISTSVRGTERYPTWRRKKNEKCTTHVNHV